jgi:hypothetical protein
VRIVEKGGRRRGSSEGKVREGRDRRRREEKK